jgi:transposase
MAQLHKNFVDLEVKKLIERYLKKEIERKYIQQILGIGKTRFFALVKDYRKNPNSFSIKYIRNSENKKISKDIEKNIIKELSVEKKFIENKNMPIKSYNYSYIRNLLIEKYDQKVSLPTIIDRAKKHGFYLKKPKKTHVHDRQVLTNYVGELIQHDTSYHLWSPYAQEKWYLITSLDDFSRYILYPGERNIMGPYPGLRIRIS